MRIYRNQDEIVRHGRIANNVWTRFLGLQFSKELPEGHGLLITPCNSVHMFFMNYPIDVVFLTKDLVVERLLPDLKPWRVSPVVVKAHQTLEVPAGTIAKYDLKVGDRLEIKE
ncbi:hypothetical protein D3C87_1787580 [compost metagenome]